MSMLEDLYSEDLIGDPETLERNETDGPLFMEDEDDEQNEEAEKDDLPETLSQSDNVVITKKRRAVRNPQPKLNAERLQGPRGLTMLENSFKEYQFCGKGHEKKDLDEVMKRLEHWAHRLFPKYQFDDCLEKLEILGHKKPVMTYVKKIRMGLETSESAISVAEINEEVLGVPLDPFDELLSQQISDIYSQQSSTPVSNTALDSPHPPKIVLTEEQKQRMERNRLIAQERRLARLKALQDQTENSAENVSISTVNDRNSTTFLSETEQPSVTLNKETSSEERNIQKENEWLEESVTSNDSKNTENNLEPTCIDE